MHEETKRTRLFAGEEVKEGDALTKEREIKESVQYEFEGLISEAEEEALSTGLDESTWISFAEKMEQRLEELVKEAATNKHTPSFSLSSDEDGINPLILSAGVLIKQALESLSKDKVMAQLDSVLEKLDLESSKEIGKVREEKRNYSAHLLKEVKELVDQFNRLPVLYGSCHYPKDLKECDSSLHRFSEKGTVVARRVDFEVTYNSSSYWGLEELSKFVSEESDPAINYLILQKHPDLIDRLSNPTEHMQLYCIYKYPGLVGKISGLTYKAKFLAVTLDPDTLALIPNADESLQLVSVRSKGSCIKHIAKPSKEVQLAAVKNDIGAFDLITKPHKEVLAYLKK